MRWGEQSVSGFGCFCGAQPQNGEDAGGVVGAQEVHGVVEGEGGIMLPQNLQSRTEGGGVAAQQIIQGGCPEGVVHQAVQVAAQQVFPPDAVGDLVGAVLPHLAQHHGVGVLLLHRLPQTGNEGVRQLICHVQSPAVRSGSEPAADDGVFISIEVLAAAGTVLIQRGQGGDAPPAVVVVRPVLPLVPGGKGRGLGSGRILEVAGGGASVAEHPVQQHPHPTGVGGVTEGAKVGFRAQQRVDGLVVGGAVPVVLRRKMGQR